MTARLSDEEFQTACREVRVIASFHGEDSDPAVRSVLQEAERARAGETEAKSTLDRVLDCLEGFDRGDVAAIECVIKALKAGGRG